MPGTNVAGDLRAQNPAPHLDSSLGPPTAGRWADGRPAFTPARIAAIAEKRAYDAACAAGVFDRATDAATLGVALRDAQPLRLSHLVPAFAELTTRPLRLLAALLLLHKAGHDGVLLKHAELAVQLDTSERTARRAMAVLVTRGWVRIVAPAFVRHGRASSRRGNVYAVDPEVLASLGRIRAAMKLGQASGTALGQESEPSGSGAPAAAALDAGRPGDHVLSMAAHACGQPGPGRSTGQGRITGAARPETRQGETRNVARKAPDGEVATSTTLLDEIHATSVAIDDPDLRAIFDELRKRLEKGHGGPPS